MSMPTSTPLYKKNITDGGLDADKDTNPRARMQYLALDTQIWYICFEDGIWTPQKIPIPLPTYADPMVNTVDSIPQSIYTVANDICFLSFNIPNGLNGNNTVVFSTSSTVAGLADDNILAVYTRISDHDILKTFSDGIIKKGTPVYVYRKAVGYLTYSALMADIKTFAANTITGSNGLLIKIAQPLKMAVRVVA